jgi:hypothetical protein
MRKSVFESVVETERYSTRGGRWIIEQRSRRRIDARGVHLSSVVPDQYGRRAADQDSRRKTRMRRANGKTARIDHDALRSDPRQTHRSRLSPRDHEVRAIERRAAGAHELCAGDRLRLAENETVRQSYSPELGPTHDQHRQPVAGKPDSTLEVQ